MDKLQQALLDPIWVDHKSGDKYLMDGKQGWKIAYYPIFEDSKTGKQYDSPRALVEKPMVGGGTDFREVPLRFLSKEVPTKSEMVEWLKDHLATTPKEVIQEKWEAIEKQGYGGPTAKEYLNSSNSITLNPKQNEKQQKH